MTYTDAFNKLDSLFESVCNNYDYYCMFEAAGDEKQDSGAAKKFINAAVGILKKFIVTVRNLVASITSKIKSFVGKFGSGEVMIPDEIEVCSGLITLDYRLLSDIKSAVGGIISGSLEDAELDNYISKLVSKINGACVKTKVVNFKFNVKAAAKYLNQVEKLAVYLQNEIKEIEANVDEKTYSKRISKLNVITQFGKFLNVLSSDISRLTNIAKSLGAENKEEPQQESVELENNALSAKLLIEAANLLAKSGENKDTIDVEFNW